MKPLPLAFALVLVLSLPVAALPAFAQAKPQSGRAELNLNDDSNDDADNDGIRNKVDRVDNRYGPDGRLLRLKVGQLVPDEAYRRATVVDAHARGLRAAPVGAMWLEIRGDLLLVGADGYVIEAIYAQADAPRA